MIPQAALIADQQGVYVFVVEDGKAVVRRVKTGGENGTDIVVDDRPVRRRAGHRRGPAERPSGRGGAGAPAAACRAAGLIPCSPSIFVDRPRLAIVIAIVTTIAGALGAVLASRSRNIPDIVPPQVSVTTMFPGASAAVVDATVAQPIEAQVVGVDKMIYMKSVSGDDGSYTLTASFELGTDPDINTVNVNNRVQIALPACRRRCGARA